MVESGLTLERTSMAEAGVTGGGTGEGGSGAASGTDDCVGGTTGDVGGTTGSGTGTEIFSGSGTGEGGVIGTGSGSRGGTGGSGIAGGSVVFSTEETALPAASLMAFCAASNISSGTENIFYSYDEELLHKKNTKKYSYYEITNN